MAWSRTARRDEDVAGVAGADRGRLASATEPFTVRIVGEIVKDEQGSVVKARDADAKVLALAVT